MAFEKRLQPRIINSVAAVAEKIQRAKSKEELGKTIFLIGAGCSITAGVPGAQDIAKKMVVEVARNFNYDCADDEYANAYRSLLFNGKLRDLEDTHSLNQRTDNHIDWYYVYDQMFERHYCTRDETRELFGKLVEGAKGTINWAHLCLGELAARGYISTVLTTNFDQLVLSGMVRAGLLPVVCDGIESLNRIAAPPRHPQLIELHGSRHTYVLRNRPDDVRRYGEDATATGAIQGLIQHANTFVVIGYAGREEGVMKLLIQAARVFDDKNLFWVQRSAKPEDLSMHAAEFLATTRNGGLIVNQDADRFFLDLCAELGIGAPSAISDPLRIAERTIASVSAANSSNPDINREIAKAKWTVSEARKFLKEREASTIPSEAIRKLRLAGRHEEAYHRANEALGK